MTTPIAASGPPFARLQPALSPWILEHLDAQSFRNATPVQASTIPLLLKHKDVIVEAVTGSGKTLAYLLPLIEMICPGVAGGEGAEEAAAALGEKDDSILAVVLLPTRELAIQVYAVLLSLLASAPTSVTSAITPQLVVGGGKTPYHRAADRGTDEEDDGVGGANNPQQDFARLRKQRSNVIIGPPGRVEQLLGKGVVRTKAKALQLLVLDEADRLLDLGFLPSLSTILSCLPKQRRTALFSATMTDALDQLVRLGLRNPVRITVRVETKKKAAAAAQQGKAAASEDARIPATLQNFYLITPRERKVAQLVRLLQYEPEQHGTRKVVVFFATCRQVEYFYKVLAPLQELRGCKLFSLHGKQNPTRREAVFRSFVDDIPVPGSASGEIEAGSSSLTTPPPTTASTHSASVLLCTDVASRGLDLPNLDLVVQFDPPLDPKVFNHRIGRTARAGKAGRAICLLARGSEESYMDFLALRGVRGSRYPALSQAPVRAEGESAKTKGKGKQKKGATTSLAPLPPVQQISSADADGLDEGATQLAESLRSQNLADLATHDLFVLALVSYVRAYGKHEARFIFPMKDLVVDLRDLARSWGGVRLPRMGELKGKGGDKGKGKQVGQDATEAQDGDDVVASDKVDGEEDGWLVGRVDVDSWCYQDPAKEKARQLKLQQRAQDHGVKTVRASSSNGNEDGDEDAADGTAAGGPMSRRKRMRQADESAAGAWSHQKEKKERKELRREKKARKREAIKAKAREEAGLAAGAGGGGAQGDEDEDEDDWSEDERAFKRERKRERREKSRLAGERGVRREARNGGDDDTGFEMTDGEGGDGDWMEADGEGGGFFDGL